MTAAGLPVLSRGAGGVPVILLFPTWPTTPTPLTIVTGAGAVAPAAAPPIIEPAADSAPPATLPAADIEAAARRKPPSMVSPMISFPHNAPTTKGAAIYYLFSSSCFCSSK